MQQIGLKDVSRMRAVRCFAAAALVICGGLAVAVASFPDGFDWVYTVISKLASRKHNPTGAVWLCGSLLAAACLLWPVTWHLERALDTRRSARIPLGALRVGIAGAGLLALEGLFAIDLSRIARKGHELLALTTFVGLYVGVVGLHAQRIRHAVASGWTALLVLLPLCAVGVSQFVLYLTQRDVGWVGPAWREMGIPLWLSFAFWQWLAVACLAGGLGSLVMDRSTAAARSA